MKKVKSLFTPKKLVILICIILLIFTLPTINKPAMSETQAIVTMLCIDKEEEKIIYLRVVAQHPGKQNGCRRSALLTIYISPQNLH